MSDNIADARAATLGLKLTRGKPIDYEITADPPEFFDGHAVTAMFEDIGLPCVVDEGICTIQITEEMVALPAGDNYELWLYDNGVKWILIDVSLTNKGTSKQKLGATIVAESVQLSIKILPAASRSFYLHTQVNPAMVWVVQHNMNAYPSMPLIHDENGDEMSGIVTHLNTNVSLITFDEPVAGTASF